MPTQGASIVVLAEDGRQVLLHKRADFHVWALPGGGVEAGEDIAAAAVREVREETGFVVALDCLSAEYWFPQSKRTVFLYKAHVTGGNAIERGLETLAVQWFTLDALPSRMAPFTRERIHAAVTNANGTIKQTRLVPFWQRTFMIALVSMRDVYNRLTGHP